MLTSLIRNDRFYKAGGVLLLSALLIAAVVTAVVLTVEKPPLVGKGDFIAYWSASYLLARGEDFTDGDLLVETQRTLTLSRRDYVYRTWNPPWLLVILAPYTLFSFTQAAWLWLLTNIALVFFGSIILWRTYGMTERPWPAPIVAFLFLPTLTAFALGQVNTLVFFGLVMFLWAWSRGRFALAGAALSLTMIKPHLVYLLLPLIFLFAMWRRRWGLVGGFAGTLLVLTVVAWGLRPSFIADYIAGISEPSLLQWATPTLGGFLANYFGWDLGRYVGVLLLPLTLWLWWTYRDRLGMVTLLNLSLGFSIFTAPFGWSYDAILLLLPLVQIVAWMRRGAFKLMDVIFLIVAFFSVEAGIYYGRINSGEGEVYFFWAPLAIGLIYLYAWLRRDSEEVTLQNVAA